MEDTHRVRGWGTLLLPVCLLVSPGCYTYHETSVTALEPDEAVRVTLNAAGARAVLPGGGGAESFEARFTEAAPDTLVFSVWIGAAYRGTPFESTYQRIVVPRSDVRLVEDRQLSRNRSALVAAGVIAAIVVLIDQLDWVPIFSRDGGGGTIDPPETEGVILRR
ncbi:MAG: hypothetical protein WEF86_09280 [Gemmatimonadota bacterium]